MTDEAWYLGIVQGGKFRLLRPAPIVAPFLRLTVNPLTVRQPPESGELDLRRYEGRALMVRGQADSGWIYGARVLDEAGPILSAVVWQVFGQSDR